MVGIMMSNSVVKNEQRSGDPASLQDPGVIRSSSSVRFSFNIMHKT